MVRKSIYIYSIINKHFILIEYKFTNGSICLTVNGPHKINGKQLDVKKALPKDGAEQRGGGRQGPGGRNDNWGNGGT